MSDMSPSARMRMTLDLFDLGLELQRQNLRRRHPDEDDAAISQRLEAWLAERPGAPFGDAEGRPRPVVDRDERPR